MKIGMIINALAVSGGAERQFIELAREFTARGHDVCIYTFEHKPEACFPGILGTTPVIALDQKVSRRAARLFRKRVIGTFFHQIAENKKAKALARLMDNDLEVLNPHEQISMRVATYYKRLTKNAPSVAMVNDLHLAGWSLFDDPVFDPPRKAWWQRVLHTLRDWYERYVFIRRQDIIAVLNERTRGIIRRLLGLEAVVVRSGVSLDRFPYKERTPISGKKIKILCHGIFYVHRRFEDVIAAVELLLREGYDPYLDIIGNYEHNGRARDYHQKLTTLVSKLGLDSRVRFRGFVSDEELLQYYYAADVFVFASHMQTWGIAVFEAMATGVPVVLSDTAGASEVLTHGENVLLFEALNPGAIAAQLRRLAEDPARYAALSTSGNHFVRAHITWKRQADAFEKLFERTLREHR